jgi:ribosome biogenesis GTPase
VEIQEWGWDDRWETAAVQATLEAGLRAADVAPGRVIADTRGLFRVVAEAGTAWSRPTGRLWDRIAGSAAVPVTGDWVLVEAGEGTTEWPMHAVLPRRSALSRKSPTDARHAAPEQVLAANVDLLLLVFGLDGGRNFTERGLERYVTAAWQSGATPLVVLNKADLAADRELAELRARESAPGVEVISASTVTDGGLDELAAHLRPALTVAMVGRSGVGKSTIANRLLGEELLATQANRAGDLRGRHTTSLRQMVRLASGALLIDTPGLRELGLWGDERALEESFSDITELAAQCRFADCAHRGEPGCAVQQALAEGALDPARYESYLDLQRELRHLNRKEDVRARLEQKARSKTLAKHIRTWSRESGKRLG